MAIQKQTKNLSIKVSCSYNLIVGGKLEKIADEIFVHATKKNLTLVSNKKIVSDGNKH